MKNVVVRNIQRADAKALATFEKLGTSTVHEALGRYQLMKPYMRPVWAGGAVVFDHRIATGANDRTTDARTIRTHLDDPAGFRAAMGVA